MSEPKFQLSPQSKKQIERLGHVRLGGYGVLDPDPIKVTDANKEFEGEIWRRYVPDGILKEIPQKTSAQAYRSKAAEVKAKRELLEKQRKELEALEAQAEALEKKKAEDEARAARLAAANPPKGDFAEKSAPSEPAAAPAVAPAPASSETAESDSETKKTSSAAQKRLKRRKKARRLSEAKAKPAVPTQEPPDPVVVPESEEIEVITADTITLPTKTEIRSYSRDEAEKMAKTLGVWDSIEGTGKDGYRVASDIEKALLAYVEEKRS